MRISGWSSDVCSSDLRFANLRHAAPRLRVTGGQGSYAPNGQIQLAARAHSPDYGPVGVHLAGTINDPRAVEIGRGSCGERVSQYVLISVAAGALTTKQKSYIDRNNTHTQTYDG